MGEAITAATDPRLHIERLLKHVTGYPSQQAEPMLNTKYYNRGNYIPGEILG